MTKNVATKTVTYHAWPGNGYKSWEQQVLPEGEWVDITPPIDGGFPGDTYGCQYVAIDPSNPGTLYACMASHGIWRSENYGETWTQLDGATAPDSPQRVLVDPNDPDHLIAVQGVAGATLGFYVSNDRGATWDWPAGFSAVASSTTNDVTTMVVNPTDFDHILIGSHSPWSGLDNAGILETRDGGATFTAHAPESTWPVGSLGIGFAYDPATEQGDSDTWVVGTDGDGIWRTTNGGTSWTKVSTVNIVHHGCMFTYDSTGAMYTGAQPYPIRSTNNGATWSQLTTGLTSSTYYTVLSDGETLYTAVANTGENGGAPGIGSLLPWKAATEGAPGSWSSYQSGAQTYINGPFNMVHDPVSDVVYAACWRGGLLALKPIRA